MRQFLSILRNPCRSRKERLSLFNDYKFIYKDRSCKAMRSDFHACISTAPLLQTRLIPKNLVWNISLQLAKSWIIVLNQCQGGVLLYLMENINSWSPVDASFNSGTVSRGFEGNDSACVWRQAANGKFSRFNPKFIPTDYFIGECKGSHCALSYGKFSKRVEMDKDQQFDRVLFAHKYCAFRWVRL